MLRSNWTLCNRDCNTDRKRFRFIADQSGGTAILFGLLAMLMFSSMGLAIDTLRWSHAKKQTSSALDAAVLAGGRALQVNPSNPAAAISVAQSFYKKNTELRSGVTDDTITFVVGENGLYFEARGNAYLKTTLLKLMGIDRLSLLDDSGARHARAELGVGKNADSNLEIAVMLDVTGSMAGSKLQDMQDAAHELVDIVVWDDQSTRRSRMALIPFSQAVNVGRTFFAAITNKDTYSTVTQLTKPSPSDKDESPSSWPSLLLPSKAYAQTSGEGATGSIYSSCVVERNGPDGFSDVAPGADAYLTAYDIAKANVGHVKYSPCKPGSVTVQPLTSDKTKLHAKIDSFIASGYTAGHIGTAFSWYTLSPAWSTIWPTESQPASYSDSEVKKIAILMTDGEYNTAYNGASNGNSASQAVQLCTNMKSKGIVVYTVGFELGGNASALQVMKDCANSSKEFYEADNGVELKQAFRDIAVRISQLYLSR